MEDTPKQIVDNLICKVNYDYQDIKYSVYRVAMKLCHLQQYFKLETINHNLVQESFNNFMQQKFGKSVQFVTDEVLKLKELTKIVENVLKPLGTDVTQLKDCLSFLIFNTFEDVRQNVVGVLPSLLFFLVLGSESIKMKYKTMFELYTGSLKVMSRSRLSLCLTHFVRITDIVGESGNFSKIKPAVDSCFEGVLGSSISENHFLSWLEMEPQSVVWLPTMHRLNVAKTSVHNVQCATCKVRPIVGLRFQCLRCLDYNSCQVCFLTRKCVTRSHRLTHPRQEYCLPAGSKQKVNALARTVRNIVTKRYKRKALSSGFLPIQQKGDRVDEEDFAASNFEDVNNLAEQEKQELEMLVTKLKDENEKMSGTVDLLETSKNEVVKLDEERAILQSELDTVNLHNRNLKAELDNLKCVVFADGFADDEADDTMDERSSISSSYVDESNNRVVETGDHRSEAQYENKQGFSTEDSFENPFLLHADSLLLSMDEESKPSHNRRLVLAAAMKMSNNFCDVIDCALDIV